MTNGNQILEDAISKWREEMYLAFKRALEEQRTCEPCEDAISRQEALKLFATNDGKYLYEAIRDLPSVTPKQKQERITDDAISRQAVMRVLDEIGSDFDSPRNAVVSLDEIADAIQDLPSVTPNQRTGHWIQAKRPFNFRFKCSDCGRPALKSERNGNDVKSKYCPRCGARMESEEQE